VQTCPVHTATRKLSSLGLLGYSILVAAGLAASPVRADTKCKLAKVVEFPITMSGLKPTLTAKINGVDEQFVLDSGAFYSMISSATAAQFNLKQRPAPFGFKIKGVGGSTDATIATVREFTLAGTPMHDIEFLVGGSEAGNGAILGQNFLEKWDVEYDLAKGVIRLFKAEDCKHTNLAYWAAAGQPVSIMDIGYTTPLKPHTTGRAFINGVKIGVMFDTGAWASMLSLKAAARAGVKPDTAGVVDAGSSIGIGRGSVKNYIAPFSSFKIGDDEEIKNARLRIADIDLEEGDMLLGADFFLSHHVYVANSQHRLYITYNGGPVFNLSKSASAGATDAPETKNQDEEPADAAAFARRGAAFAARHDFEHALADLTRACELNPNEPEYAYQRGMAYWENNQPIPAMADFDHALELNPDYVQVRVVRAQLRLANKDIAGANADLDVADRVAPKQADIRFTMGELYGKADVLGSAVTQYDLWIISHPDDSKMMAALYRRCSLRALQGQDLGKGLSDCNSALRLSSKSDPASASILRVRGLVRLRLGDYDKSIADFDDSLKLAPKNAEALYGRGVAELRKHKTPEGQADLAEASKLRPNIAAEFSRRGISP
jgi:tetratricopeptide (TPR) repeat protein